MFFARAAHLAARLRYHYRNGEQWVEECGYILANSRSSSAFVENAKQRAKVEEPAGRGFELDGSRTSARRS